MSKNHPGCYNEFVESATGTFETTARPEPPFASDHGMLLGRMEIDKVFHGALTGTSTVHMLYARTPVETSAGYVAVEHIEGTLAGRQGSFVVLHVGLSSGDDASLTLSIVPDSGADELAGISGSMTIAEIDSVHQYTVDYQLAG